MYLNPHESMQLLKITTRQGLHKIVKNYNITVKSQGVGRPNLYLKSDLEKYMVDNAKNIKIRKNPQVIEKAEKIEKDIKERKVKNKKLKEEVKKELGIVHIKENFSKVECPKCKSLKFTNIDTKFNFTCECGNIFNHNKKELETKEEIIDEDSNIPNEKPIKPKKNKADFKMDDLLNEIGMNEFERVSQLLKDNGTYKEEDRGLVLSYAVTYQNWVHATVSSGMEDNTTTDQFGNLKLHPYFMVAKDCLSQMTKIAGILGLGVRSRIGVDIKKDKPKGFSHIINSKGDFND